MGVLRQQFAVRHPIVRNANREDMPAQGITPSTQEAMKISLQPLLSALKNGIVPIFSLIRRALT